MKHSQPSMLCWVARLQANNRVLNHDALGGLHAQALRRCHVDLRVRLLALHVVAAKEDVQVLAPSPRRQSGSTLSNLEKVKKLASQLHIVAAPKMSRS